MNVGVEWLFVSILMRSNNRNENEKRKGELPNRVEWKK